MLNQPEKSKVKGKTKKTGTEVIYAIVTAVFILLDIIFITFVRSEAKTIHLLRTELQNLEQNERIIVSSNEIYATYAEEIDLISAVFPNEETIPLFIETIETLLRSTTDEYSFKFNAVTPLKEGDKLFLPFTLTVKTDLARFLSLLNQMGQLPYMIHVTQIISKTPEGFSAKSEYIIVLKVYVQNPFTNNQ